MPRRTLRAALSAAFVASIAACGLAMLSPAVEAYPGPDAQCPCGWDTRTNTCQPRGTSGPAGGQLDAACQATARFDYCQGSVTIGCRSYGFPAACRLLQLSYSDPQTFQRIMNAQKACLLDRDAQACAYLQQYKGVYF